MYEGPSEAFLSLANEWFGIPVMQTSRTSMLFQTYNKANFCGDYSDWWRLICISDTFLIITCCICFKYFDICICMKILFSCHSFYILTFILFDCLCRRAIVHHSSWMPKATRIYLKMFTTCLNDSLLNLFCLSLHFVILLMLLWIIYWQIHIDIKRSTLTYMICVYIYIHMTHTNVMMSYDVVRCHMMS